MVGFGLPSDDPPSTPDSRRASMNNGPSTTPAGPPPTNYTSYSFTPAGAPPASVFGSSLADGNSMFPMSKPAFAPSGHLNSPSLKAPLHTNPFGSFQPLNSKPAQKPFGFAAPASSPPQAYAQEEDYDQDAEGEVDDQAMDVDTTGRGFSRPSTQASLFGQPAGAMASPRGFKRSRRGDVMDRSFRSSTNSVLEKRTSAYTGIAKSIAAGIRGPTLEEPDELVLKSEQLLADLHQHITRGQHMALEDHVADTVSQIAGLWEQSAQKETMPGSIGPKAAKSNITKANYLASLLLQLHHPRSIQSGAVQRQSLTGHSKKFSSLVTRPAITPVPKALLDWINTYHNPFPEDVEEVLDCDPAPSAHERFWDVIYATIVRGKLDTAIELFESAGFDYAESAIEDGYDEPGYRGRQLASVQHVVSQCIQLLRSCPAVTDNDWDTRNTDWALFRNRVRNTLYDLEAYAEGDSADRNGANGDSNVFQRSTNLSMSTASRRAESKVPWTVYENLRAVYGQLQGQREEIMLCCQDWLEASVFMTAWWNGDDEEALGGSLAASRHSLARAQHTRHVDVSPLTAYRKKLLKAFASVTDQPEDTVFGVNTVDPVQVGLALVCEGNVEGLLEILRKWSVPIGAAVVEIASAGGWLPQARPRSAGIMEGLDQDDLMVLSHGQEQQQGDVRMDDILIGYAELLLGRDEFRSQDGRTVREGWELACRVLSRLDSLDTAQRKLRELLEKVELDGAERVDRILDVCNELGLPGQAQTISERYADSLADSTHDYGLALLYYARAHSAQKLKSTLDLLVSMCLVQSAAYPPPSSLDTQLHSLLNDQRHALQQLARTDLQAAQLIATYLSGYATLRKFYELRDEEVDENVPRSGLKPAARRREAAQALLAVVESAADSIRGGLYDSEVDAVVQVDALLALLGESLMLMNQSQPLLKPAQLLLIIRAVEDLQTVTPRVYEQSEALFLSAIQHYHSPAAASTQDLAKSLRLAKSVSNLSGSSYGMVDSQGSVQSVHEDGLKRAWDWRKGIVAVGGKNVRGKEMLRVLRVQVVREMAGVWSGAQL